MSSLSTLPKGDSAWLLRKSIQRIMQQVSVLETNIGSSTTGNSANTQVIFNDAGTLRGDAGLTYNKATDTLSTGSATITGDLTVDTSTLKVDSTNDRVGIGTATPSAFVEIYKNTNGQNRVFINNPSTGASAYSSIDLTSGTAAGQIFQLGSGYSGSYPFITGSTILQNNGLGGIVLNSFGPYPVYFGTNNVERYRIASDGVATWSNVGGVAGTAMTLNSTGLGVGVSPTEPLTVRSSAAAIGMFHSTNVNGPYVIFHNSTGKFGDIGSELAITGGGSAGNLTLNSRSTSNLCFAVSDSVKMRIDSSGNVGIGVVPSAWVAGAKALQFGAYGSLAQSSSGNIELSFNSYNSGAGAYKYLQTDTASLYRASSVHSWFVAPSGTAGNAITFTQAMTLDASGKLNLGVASPYNAARLTVQSAGGAGGISVAIQNDDDSYYAINFRNSSGTSCGSISCTTSSTSFNVSSDYRLKEAVQPLTGGLTRVNALKPSIYKWKVNGSTGEGFIAHELADVVPFAVTGDKDAVDADGKPSYQGVDLSKLVPILVAAIQELTARVQTLEAK